MFSSRVIGDQRIVLTAMDELKSDGVFLVDEFASVRHVIEFVINEFLEEKIRYSKVHPIGRRIIQQRKFLHRRTPSASHSSVE